MSPFFRLLLTRNWKSALTYTEWLTVRIRFPINDPIKALLSTISNRRGEEKEETTKMAYRRRRIKNKKKKTLHCRALPIESLQRREIGAYALAHMSPNTLTLAWSGKKRSAADRIVCDARRHTIDYWLHWSRPTRKWMNERKIEKKKKLKHRAHKLITISLLSAFVVDT